MCVFFLFNETKNHALALTFCVMKFNRASHLSDRISLIRSYTQGTGKDFTQVQNSALLGYLVQLLFFFFDRITGGEPLLHFEERI